MDCCRPCFNVPICFSLLFNDTEEKEMVGKYMFYFADFSKVLQRCLYSADGIAFIVYGVLSENCTLLKPNSIFKFVFFFNHN